MSAGDIAAGEFDGVFDGFIEDFDAVVIFECGDESAHHGDGFGDVGFFNFDDLKAAGESSIAFEVFFEFGPGSGGDGSQFTACEGWFEEVGGIALSGLTTSTDQRVSFVYEQDNGSDGLVNFFDDAFESIFEFAFDASTGLEEAEVESANGDVLEGLRDVTVSNPEGETFDDSGFADAGFAGEDGVILSASCEDVDDLADFGIASEDGVDFAGFGAGGEVDGELVKVWCVSSRFSGGARLCRCGGAGATGSGIGGDFGAVGDDLGELAGDGIGRDA